MKSKRRIKIKNIVLSIFGISLLSIPLIISTSCANQPIQNVETNNSVSNNNNNTNSYEWPFKVGDTVFIKRNDYLHYDDWRCWIGIVVSVNNSGIATNPIKRYGISEFVENNPQYKWFDVSSTDLPNVNGFFTTWSNIKNLIY